MDGLVDSAGRLNRVDRHGLAPSPAGRTRLSPPVQLAKKSEAFEAKEDEDMRASWHSAEPGSRGRRPWTVR
jgi:hypothetical protein